jgi:hypothetical protein
LAAWVITSISKKQGSFSLSLSRRKGKTGSLAIELLEDDELTIAENAPNAWRKLLFPLELAPYKAAEGRSWSFPTSMIWLPASLMEEASRLNVFLSRNDRKFPTVKLISISDPFFLAKKTFFSEKRKSFEKISQYCVKFVLYSADLSRKR